MHRRVLAVGAALTLATCVPASEPAPPAGAAGVAIEPSAASRGEPFTTEDGWTVRIESLAVAASVAAYPAANGGFSESMASRWNGAKATRLFARALPTGPCTVGIQLTGFFGFFEGGGQRPSSREPRAEDVSPEILARFRGDADDWPHTEDERSRVGPSVIVAARAEKEGRVVTFDLALAAYSLSDLTVVNYDGVVTHGRTVDVRADDIAVLSIDLAAEQLFARDQGAGLHFNDIAAADADGDGRVTADELRVVIVSVLRPEDCPDCPHTTNLIRDLSRRGGNVLVYR